MSKGGSQGALHPGGIVASNALRTRSNTTKYTNCIRLKLNNEHLTTRNSIITSLRLDFGEECVKNIKLIMQRKRNTNWIVAFNDSFNAFELYNKSTLIDNIAVEIIDPNFIKPKETIFRVMWLFPYTDHSIIKEYFASKGIPNQYVTDIINEKCYEQELKHIDNGVIRVVCKFDDSINDKFNSMTGRHIINGEKAFISRVGDHARCFHCNSIEHIKRDCLILKETLKKVCTKCGRRGHNANECTLAKRLVQVEAVDEPDFEVLSNSNLNANLISGAGLAASSIANSTVNLTANSTANLTAKSVVSTMNHSSGNSNLNDMRGIKRPGGIKDGSENSSPEHTRARNDSTESDSVDMSVVASNTDETMPTAPLVTSMVTLTDISKSLNESLEKTTTVKSGNDVWRVNVTETNKRNANMQLNTTQILAKEAAKKAKEEKKKETKEAKALAKTTQATNLNHATDA